MRTTPPPVLAAVLVLLLSCESAAAQQRWAGGPLVRLARPTGTMGRYLGNGQGLSLVLHPPLGAVGARVEAGWLSFGSRTVSRPYQGTSSTMVDITSSARVLLALGGVQLTTGAAGLRFSVGVQAGAAHTLATGSTVLPGDPVQVQRSNTYTTLTWAAGARGAMVVPLGAAELAFDAGFLQLGRTKFLREYNLPIGVISGVYLYPTPYAPSFATAGVSLRLPL